MAQASTYAVEFWEHVDRMRSEIFSSEELTLLERIKPSDRFEESLARI